MILTSYLEGEFGGYRKSIEFSYLLGWTNTQLLYVETQTIAIKKK